MSAAADVETRASIAPVTPIAPAASVAPAAPRTSAAPAGPAATAEGSLSRTPWFHLLVYCLDRSLTGRLDLRVDESQVTSVCLQAGHPAAVVARRRTESGETETYRIPDVASTITDMFELPGTTSYAYFDGVAAIPPDVAPTPCDLLSVAWAGLLKAPPWNQISATLGKLEGAPMAVEEARIARFAADTTMAPLVDTLRKGPTTFEALVSLRCADPNTTGLFVYALLLTKCVRRIAPEVAKPPSAALGRVQLKKSGGGAVRTAVEEAAYDRRFDPRSSGSIPMPEEVKAAIAKARRSEAKIEAAPGAAPAPPSSGSLPASSSSSGKLPASGPSSARAPVANPNSSRHLVAAVAIPDDLPGNLRERALEIRERHGKIAKETYFEMLAVPKDATKEQIQSAYVTLAKKWHPDRLPDRLAFMKDESSKVFALLSEASAVLSDDTKRNAYLQAVVAGVGTLDEQRQVEDVLEASNSYQKSLIYLKKNDLVKAEEFVRRALDLDSEQADYVALDAWLTAQKPESQSLAKTLACIEQLSRALKMNDKCERAYFYRGSLHKRAGNVKGAVADFREAVELNPRNLDATRELRISEMRGQSEAPPKPEKESKGGFFGKLLKR